MGVDFRAKTPSPDAKKVGSSSLPDNKKTVKVAAKKLTDPKTKTAAVPASPAQRSVAVKKIAPATAAPKASKAAAVKNSPKPKRTTSAKGATAGSGKKKVTAAKKR